MTMLLVYVFAILYFCQYFIVILLTKFAVKEYAMLH